MEKRLALTIALSALILVGWMLIQQKFFPPPPATPPQAEAPSAPASPAPPTPKETPGSPSSAKTTAPAAERPAEQRITVERPGLYHAVFTTYGAAPAEFKLLNPQYKTTVDGKDEPIDLVRKAARALPYVTSFSTAGEEKERSDFDLPPDAAWALVRHNDDELVYGTDVGTVHVEKAWSLPREGYALGLTVTVTNHGSRAVGEQLRVAVNGYQDPVVQQGGLLSFGKRVNLTGGECDVNEKVKRVTRSSPGGCGGGDKTGTWSEPVSEAGDVRWEGITDQYFLVAAAFGPEAQPRACHVAGEVSGRITAETVYPRQMVAPGAQQVYPMTAFAGPKLLHQLDAVAVAGQPAGLGDAVNYGWVLSAWIARPLLAVLKGIQRVVHNWGVAIILITVFLKLLTFYPTQKSMKSMKAMGKLKPKIDALKAKFPDDQARQQQETMALYKANGVNPLGSCLPMLLQMPIYIGFYSMLSNAVELYRASFVGPIRDMTAPYPPLALATGVLMFLQQRSQPATGDPQQQKMMMYMPLVFMAMTVFLPSGLTLYILTNTLLTMLHQWLMNRNDPDRKKPPTTSGKTTLKPARA